MLCMADAPHSGLAYNRHVYLHEYHCMVLHGPLATPH